MAKRITLPPDELKELKRQTKARDGNKCRYPSCKSAYLLHSHHVIFKSDQGNDTSENLISLCQKHHDCVHGKVKDLFIVISHQDSDLIPPDCNKSVKFRSYNKIGKRLRWRVPNE